MRPPAVVFDLFGTLLDIGALHSAAAAHVDDPAAFVATWREKQIAYALTATIVRRYEDFDAITVRALRYAATRHARDPAGGAWMELAAHWRTLAAHADAAPALATLREIGAAAIVLTNATPATADAALANAGLASAVDAVLSVDTLRVYKPDARVYALATAHLGAAAADVVFVSANGWDATGAAEFGMRVAWCNRTAAPAETFGAAPAWTIPDLRALPALIAAAG